MGPIPFAYIHAFRETQKTARNLEVLCTQNTLTFRRRRHGIVLLKHRVLC